MGKYDKDSAILEWIDKHGLVNSRGEKFEFDAHSFLLEPLSDWSQTIAIPKSAQIGFSESFGILKALFAAYYYKHNVIYTNPTSSASDTFVSTKVNTILDKNPALLDLVEFSKLDLKQLKTMDGGSRFIYFRGTHSGETKDRQSDATAGLSITSDLNIYDERDRSDQFVIDQYNSRLENSSYAGEWSFSNPTYPGVGVSKLWDDSDQKHWFVKCPHCGHRQYLDWIKLGEEDQGGTPEHCLVDIEGLKFVCSKCSRHITDQTRMLGEWVAKYPGKDISGYWMSQMNYIKHSVGRIREKELDREPSNFYNYVLGKPYQSEDVSIDRNIIFSNLVPGNKKDIKASYMGIDQGVTKHYVIGNVDGIFEIGTTDDWAEIEALIHKYKPEVVVSDAMPYPNAVNKLIEKFKDSRHTRIFMAYYKEPKDQSQPIQWQKGKKRHEVIVNRTMMFDIVVDKLISGNVPISMSQSEAMPLADAWSTMYRGTREDSLGIQRPTWDTSNKSIDHYAHATIYAEVAKSKATGTMSGTYETDRQRDDKQKQTIKIDDHLMAKLPDLNDFVEQYNRRRNRRR